MIRLYAMYKEDLFRSLSLLSGVASLTVVLTGLLFPGLILARTHPFSHMIFFISLCDLFASSLTSIGFPEKDTTICPYQGGFFVYFVSASWVWTAMVVYQLRCLLIYKKLWLQLGVSHFICWSVPLVTVLLPLSTNNFGQDDDLSGHAPCTYGGDSTTHNIWLSVTFFGLALMCFCLMTLWMFSVAWHFRKDGISAHKREYEIFKTTRLYPLGLFITWIPVIVFNYLRISRTEGNIYFEISIYLQTQYGTFLSMIFFYSSALVRKVWKNVFCPVIKRQSFVSDLLSSQGGDTSAYTEEREDIIEREESNNTNLTTKSSQQRTASKQSSKILQKSTEEAIMVNLFNPLFDDSQEESMSRKSSMEPDRFSGYSFNENDWRESATARGKRSSNIEMETRVSNLDTASGFVRASFRDGVRSTISRPTGQETSENANMAEVVEHKSACVEEHNSTEAFLFVNTIKGQLVRENIESGSNIG